MVSVTKRISQIKQPRGGYHPIKDFEVQEFNDNFILGEENISPQFMGLVIDYLTRIADETSPTDAFEIALRGASILGKEYVELAMELVTYIENSTWDDNVSITNACKLVAFDTVFRAGPRTFKPVTQIEPDQSTINNIKAMVNRSIFFLKEFGPVIQDGFTFSGGYGKYITSGDGDFLTEDTLWDFKVSKNKPLPKDTLQILIYYIMGLHSESSDFSNIDKIGFFNPRLNQVYTYEVSNISTETIKEIEQEIIGY